MKSMCQICLYFCICIYCRPICKERIARILLPHFTQNRQLRQEFFEYFFHIVNRSAHVARNDIFHQIIFQSEGIFQRN